jgi:hypothetical protein
MADLTALALETACGYCGAQPGEWCVRRIIFCRGLSRAAAVKHYGPSGRASYLHTVRTRPIWRAYFAGIEETRARLADL